MASGLLQPIFSELGHCRPAGPWGLLVLLDSSPEEGSEATEGVQRLAPFWLAAEDPAASSELAKDVPTSEGVCPTAAEVPEAEAEGEPAA